MKVQSMINYLASSTKGAQIFLVLSIVTTCYSLYTYGLTLNILLLILLGYFLYGCLGIVITFHRYLTHKSFETYPLLVKLFSRSPVFLILSSCTIIEVSVVLTRFHIHTKSHQISFKGNI